MRMQEAEGRRVGEQMNLSRFELYAPLLPGRRYSFDVDFEEPGQEGGLVNYDAAEDKMFGHDVYDRSSLCPPPRALSLAPPPYSTPSLNTTSPIQNSQKD
jgi:hypothetical protein